MEETADSPGARAIISSQVRYIDEDAKSLET